MAAPESRSLCGLEAKEMKTVKWDSGSPAAITQVFDQAPLEVFRARPTGTETEGGSREDVHELG